jgi:predicted secreted protein with PEFG-CTERM motif
MNYKTYALISMLITSLILFNLIAGLPAAQSKLLTLMTTNKLQYTVLNKVAASRIDIDIKRSSDDSKVDTLFHFVSTNTTSTSNGNKTYGVRIGDKTFPITYQITGSGNKLSNITAAKDNTTLLVNVGGSKADGKLTIQLPRNLIDSKKQGNQDSPYVIFEDSQPSQNVQEIKSNAQARTLAIEFDKGTDVIEIAGSKMLPEFGTTSAIVLAIAIMGIIMAARDTNTTGYICYKITNLFNWIALSFFHDILVGPMSGLLRKANICSRMDLRF